MEIGVLAHSLEIKSMSGTDYRLAAVRIGRPDTE
jgi:hypothetical protein